MLAVVARRAYLDLPDGVAVRIDAAGLLLGRHRSCDIQLEDETASRRHALLRLAPDGVELVVLGKLPVQVNDRACPASQALRDGDRVVLPGLTARVRVEAHDDSVPVGYCLRHGRERLHIRAARFVIGSGPAANVAIASLSAEALVLQVAQGELYVDSDGGTLNGVALEPGGPTAVHAGDVLGYGTETFHVELADDGDASTVLTRGSPRATAVTLQVLPRGGRVTFAFPDGDRTVYLPGRRFKLVSALARAAGELVTDSELVPLVWDDDDEVGGRQDINVLLTRCRQDLVAAQIAATSLLERAPGGRATRLVLAPGAVITTTDQ